MTSSNSFRFQKNNRLLNAAAFGRVFKKANRSRDKLFTVLSRANQDEATRLGLAISKKHCRKATARNRIKRMIRESFRHHKSVLAGLDIVVINQPAASLADKSAMQASLEKHWQRCLQAAKKRIRQDSDAMDNQRMLVWGLFGFLAWITYQTWIQDYAPAPDVTATEQSEQATVPSDVSDLPTLAAPADGPLDAPAVLDTSVPESAPSRNKAATVRVTTDVLDIEISTQGGTLQSAVLLNYPVAKDQPNTLISMLTEDAANYGVIQTGLRALGGGDEATHEVVFSSAQSSYDLGSADEIVIPLTWQGANGVRVEKQFRLTRGGYAITIDQVVSNASDSMWRGADYAQIKRLSKEHERSMFDVDSYSFTGPIVYNGEKSEKLQRDDLLEDGAHSFKATNGWVASIEHHFLNAIVPPRDTEQTYTVSVRGDRATESMIGPVVNVAPGSQKTFSTIAFVGPKMQSQLEEIDETLKLTVDYGWLTIISQPLFWLLSFVFNYVGNWGVAIILVTFLIKLAFYKLTESSGPLHGKNA